MGCFMSNNDGDTDVNGYAMILVFRVFLVAFFSMIIWELFQFISHPDHHVKSPAHTPASIEQKIHAAKSHVNTNTSVRTDAKDIHVLVPMRCVPLKSGYQCWFSGSQKSVH